MSLKVDLSKMIAQKDLVVESIKVGDFTICGTDEGGLMFLKDDRVYVEIKNNDVVINGRSVEDMWSVLENHYEALKKLIESHKSS